MVIDYKRIGNTKPLFRSAAAAARLRWRPLLARGEGGVLSRQPRRAAAARGVGNRTAVLRPAAATAPLRWRPLLARGEGGVLSRERRSAAAARSKDWRGVARSGLAAAAPPIHITGQGSSWFPLHICGVKPTVSEELQFNQQVCGGEAQHTLHTCETPR